VLKKEHRVRKEVDAVLRKRQRNCSRSVEATRSQELEDVRILEPPPHYPSDFRL